MRSFTASCIATPSFRYSNKRTEADRVERPVVALLASYPLQPNIQSVLYNLGRLLRDDFAFDLIMGPEDPPEQLQDLYTIYHVDTPPIERTGIGYALKATHEYLRNHRPRAIMNAGQPFPLGVAVVLVGKWHAVPTILRITGDYFAEAEIGTAWERWKRWLLHSKLFNAVYEQADAAVPVGPNLGDKLIQNGFDEEQVRPLPQPFDAKMFSPVSAEERRRLKKQLGLEVDRKIIAYVGRLCWAKGADRVLEIAKLVHRESDEFQFCLVGDGDYVSDFRRRFAAEEVYCAGFVPREQVHEYFQVADLLIHPTRRDGLPTVILEALASETPVIATDVGEIKNIVSNITKKEDDFKRLILDGNVEKDELPHSFRWSYQRRRYRNVICKVEY